MNGAAIQVINPVDFDFHFTINHKIISADIVWQLAQVAVALGVSDPLLKKVNSSDNAKALAGEFEQGTKKVLVLGDYALQHPHAQTIKALADLIAQQVDVKVVYLTPGCNSAGAWKAGMVPHRDASGALLDAPGDSIQSLWCDNPVRAYFLYGFEPEHDTVFASAALQALKQAGLVVCFSPFVTDAMQEYADFILPICPMTETAGTFTNVLGLSQSFVATSVPHEESKPGWKVVRALGSLLELEGFHFHNTQEVITELESLTSNHEDRGVEPSSKPQQAIEPVTGWHRYACQPIYSVDSMVRRAAPLHQTNLGEVGCLTLNSQMAAKLDVSEGDYLCASQAQDQLTLPVVVDDSIADHVVRLPAGLQETQWFGAGHGELTLQRASS